MCGGMPVTLKDLMYPTNHLQWSSDIKNFSGKLQVAVNFLDGQHRAFTTCMIVYGLMDNALLLFEERISIIPKDDFLEKDVFSVNLFCSIPWSFSEDEILNCQEQSRLF